MNEITVLIADDDEILLEGLMTKVDWESLGVKVIGGAKCGRSALSLIKEFQPNILLTDIKMPKMNGIELMQEIEKLRLNITVIVMSAYDEFSYAQQALKYGAYDYILKPINVSYLQDSFKRAIELESKKSSINEKIQFMERLEKDSEKQIISKMYEDAMTMKYSYEDFFALYKSCLDKNRFSFFQVSLLRNKFEGVIYKEIQRYLIEKHDNIKAYVIYDRLFFLFLSPKEITKNSFEEFLINIKEHFEKKYDGINLIFANGKIVDDIYVLHESMEEAILVDDISFRHNDKWLLDIDNFDSEKENQQIANSLSNKIYESILKGDVELLNHYIAIYIDNLSFCKKDAQNLLIYNTYSIIDKIQKDCKEINIELNKVINTDNPINEILSGETLKDKLNGFKSIFTKISLYLNENFNKTNDKLIKDACKYVEENYMDSSLRINDVASHICLSKNYFSSLFSSIMGKTFTDYLTETRIKNSQKLILSQQYKNYEIAYKVGFENPTYFSFAFKKYVGVNPSDYLKMINE